MADDLGARTAWWLDGNFAPVTDEVEAFDLKVEGPLPPELTGVYMRIGPNPKDGRSGHWFLGDGMLHGMRLENGRAAWYRNRYVRTPRLEQGARPMGPEIARRDSSANTNIVRHAGKFLALEEGHFPWEVGADLATKTWTDFEGKLTGAFTAHPKICPETGEMLGFGHSWMAPYLVYHRVSKDGRLVQSTEIPVNGPTMIHDFCVTRRHAIFMDLPIVFDLQLAMKGTMPYRWSDDYPARLGVMPRDGDASQLQWFDIPSCFVFHPMNAYDAGDTIVFDVARYEKLWVSGFGDASPYLTRWVIDLKNGRVSQTQLDDLAVEFPRVADAKAGLKHRYGYAPAVGAAATDAIGLSGSIVKFDLERGGTARWDFGPGRHCGEFSHAAARSGGEDDGWIMGFVHDDNSMTTSLAVLDATDVAKGPIAMIATPQRVPYGFHGNWFAD
jgi:carotenoid cleavage dioxygenase